MRNRDVYILYNDDKYQLPIYVADTLKELSELSGIYIKTLRKSLFENTTIINNLKVEKVDISEPDDKYTEETYKEYCKSENLSVGSFSSHKTFAKWCYGVLWQ